MSSHSTSKNFIVYVNILTDDIRIASTEKPEEIGFPIPGICQCQNGPILLFHLIDQEFSLNRVKGIIFIHAALPYLYYKFNLKCREMCREKGILFHFLGSFSKIILFSALANTKTVVNFGEKVLVIVAEINSYNCEILIREKTENGNAGQYRVLDTYLFDFTFDLPTLRKNIFREYDPKKFILYTVFPESERNHEIDSQVLCINRVCGTKMAIVHEPENNNFQIIEGYARHIFGESKSEYFIQTSVKYEFGLKHQNKWIMEVKKFECLPIEKSVTIKNNGKNISICADAILGSPKQLETFDVSKHKSSKIKVTLKVDHNFFYEVKMEPVE